MDSADVIRIHGQLHAYLYAALGNMLVSTFTKKQLRTFVKPFPTPPVSAPHVLGGEAGKKLLAADLCTCYSLDEITTSSDFIILGQPWERKQKLIDWYGPIFDALNDHHAHITIDTDPLELITADLSEVERAGTSWQLVKSQDTYNNLCAAPVLVGQFAVSSEDQLKQIYCFLSQLNTRHTRTHRELHKIRGRLGSQQGEHKKLLERVEKQEKALAKRDKHIKELEEQLRESEQRPQTPKEQDYDALAQQYKDACAEAKENLELAQSYQQDLGDALAQREELEDKLQKTGHALHTAYKDVKRLERKLNAQQPNGGIRVYATQELQERYQELYTYTDHELNEPFSDIIDEAIKHICERIKEGGKSAQQEFDYMKQVKSHFYKKKTELANGRAYSSSPTGKAKLPSQT